MSESGEELDGLTAESTAATPLRNQQGVATAYSEARKARKEAAAETMKAEAKAAKARKTRALAKAPADSEAEAFVKRAREIEKNINTKSESE